MYQLYNTYRRDKPALFSHHHHWQNPAIMFIMPEVRDILLQIDLVVRVLAFQGIIQLKAKSNRLMSLKMSSSDRNRLRFS